MNPAAPSQDKRTQRPRPKRLRQHTNPLAFQGSRDRPDWDALLGGHPQELEIGFGLGELLLERAAMRPGARICGIDVRWAYVERVREAAAELPQPLPHLHFVHAEGKLALQTWLDEASVSHVVVYFPDPWFKKRHAKRRIINPEVTALITRVLKPGGLLHVATDQEPLAHEMMGLLTETRGLSNVMGAGRFAPYSVLGAMSGREVEHLKRGQRIWRLTFRREAGKDGTRG
jgi:tRNA (guanine-N7-)-methyltransferase